jgi:hypothetical protein
VPVCGQSTVMSGLFTLKSSGHLNFTHNSALYSQLRLLHF